MNERRVFPKSWKVRLFVIFACVILALAGAFAQSVISKGGIYLSSEVLVVDSPSRTTFLVRLYNFTNTPLRVVPRPECGCTRVALSSEILKPFSMAYCRVTIDSPAQYAGQQKAVCLETDRPDRRYLFFFINFSPDLGS